MRRFKSGFNTDGEGEADAADAGDVDDDAVHADPKEKVPVGGSGVGGHVRFRLSRRRSGVEAINRFFSLSPTNNKPER
jgi:hypothetical protein